MPKDPDEKVIPRARGRQTGDADFDRNRDGLYGGLPKARDPAAAGAKPKAPHPPGGGKPQSQGAARTRG